MPIRTEEEYETALETVVDLLGAGALTGDKEATLHGLMADIEAYRPTFPPSPSDASETSERARDLIARARDLQAKYAETTKASWNSLPTDGRGVGPTTGV
ncbi:MAG: hypothetical protein U1C74_08205 [Phenylobacterium sp.]|nr:hypothetical protein [Phenylobacterium sp.]